MNQKKRRIHHYISSVCMFGFLLAGSACENPAVTDMHTDIHIEKQENQLTEAFFNPQSEPPPKVYEFELIGDPDGNWTGDFPGFREGHIQVQTRSSTMRGKTIHVIQTWMIVPPEPIFPPEPVLVSLKGMINLTNEKVVLNGMSDEPGVKVHVRGQLMTVGSGDFSIGGELLFNPQPELPPSPGISVNRDR